MRYLRSLAFNIAMVASGFGFSLAGLVVWLVAPRRLVEVPKAWGRFCIRALRVICGIEIRIEGREYLPSGGAIIAAQHQSALDIFIWLAVLGRPALVFKKELARIPIFGNLLVPAGMIEIDRDGAAAALRKMVLDCRDAVADGRQVVIFPEGTRVAPGTRAKLHIGIAALAKTGAVIPAATNSGMRWGARSFGKTPGVVVVKLFAPLDAKLRRDEVLEGLATRFYDEGVG